MSKHEYYEDALFNLLMEEVSNEMGEEYLAEADELNELEEADDEDCLRKLGKDTINRELSKAKRRQRRAIALKTFRVASIAALLFLVIGIASYLSIPQFRNHVQELLKGSPLPSETVSGYTGEIVAGNDTSRSFENYVEISRTYDYTDTGVVETITYENPETGDSFTVKNFTKYPACTYTPIVIPTPNIEFPKITEGNYIHGGIPGYNGWSDTPNGSSSITGGTNPYGSGIYGRINGYDPTSGAITIYPNIGPSVPNPLGTNTSPGSQRIGLYP